MAKPEKILRAISRLESDEKRRSAKLKELWLRFSTEVRLSRKKKGMSLDDFSKALGIGKSMLSYLETGGREWSLELAKRASILIS